MKADIELLQIEPLDAAPDIIDMYKNNDGIKLRTLGYPNHLCAVVVLGATQEEADQRAIAIAQGLKLLASEAPRPAVKARHIVRLRS